jgi:hypothetical protein
VDADGDGALGSDCADQAPTRHPGALEGIGTVDHDCNCLTVARPPLQGQAPERAVRVGANQPAGAGLGVMCVGVP